MAFEELVCPPDTVVTMSRYAARLHESEMDFWGVYRGPGPIDPPSRYWLGTERRMLGEHLRDAAALIESFMCCHLKPRWNRREEEAYRGLPHPLNWKRFVRGGIRATSIYEVAAEIIYVGDYGYVTVAHGGVGAEREVRVWYDDTELPIEYSEIVFGVANIELTIPRWRLVDPEVMLERDNDNRGVMWETDSNFLTTLTVGREYNDPSEQGEFIAQYASALCGCGATCERCCQTACVVPSHPRIGTVNLYPATYEDGLWTITHCLRYNPDTVRISYQSGLSTIPYELEDAVIRLAHTLMPDNPCPVGRDPQHRFWMRDRRIPDTLTRERVNCPWGEMNGAWYAWNVVVNHAENYGKGGGFLGGM